MRNRSIAVFAYNFPHKKTQDFLLRLFILGYDVSIVIACDPIELTIPESTIRTKIRHVALLSPKDIAAKIGAAYHVLPHDSPEIIQLVHSSRITLGVIAGARILKQPIISAFPHGIINFHPGLIPECRGLDAMLWSIYQGLPLGVTAHLIDARVDAGMLLCRRHLQLYSDDGLCDISERLYEVQLEILGTAIDAAFNGETTPIQLSAPYNRKMPATVEKQTLEMFPDYVRRFAEGPSIH